MVLEWLQPLPGAGVLAGGGGADLEPPMPPWLFWTYLGVSFALVAMAGLMSGLTLGLMSLDELDLEVLKRSGTQAERKHARRIMPVIANEHFLLVTLLLFNALSTEALPIFLDKLVDPVTAVLLSVSVVLVFGEILPQAVCRSYGLQVGSYSALLVRCLMALSSPISWPIGKLLDWLLGDEQTALFRRGQLKALVGLHSSAEGLGGTLTADEISIITGALDLTAKTAWTAMTPMNKVFMLPSDRPLDEETLQEILVSGHSRVPVHEPGDTRKLLGLILVKELVLVDPDQGLTTGHLMSRTLPCLPADTPLYQLLRLFEAGGSHMVALTMPPPRRPSLEQAARGSDAAAAAAASAGGAAPSSFARSSSGGGGRPPPVQPPGGQAQPLSPSPSAGGGGSLPRKRSGVIKAGDSMVYIEAEQRGPLSPQGSWGQPYSSPGGPRGSGAWSQDGAPLDTPQQSQQGQQGQQYQQQGQGQGQWGVAASQWYPQDLCGGCELPFGVRVGDPVGIITIEDVIEELLQQEIIDETDQYVDNLQVTRVDAYALTTSLPPRLRKAYAQQFTPRVGRLVVHHPTRHRHDTHTGSWKGLTVLKQQQLAPRAAFSNPTTPLAGTPLGGTPVAGSPEVGLASPLAAALSGGAAGAAGAGGEGALLRHAHAHAHGAPSRLSGEHAAHHPPHMQQVPEQGQLRPEEAAAAEGGDDDDAALRDALSMLPHHGGHVQVPHLHLHHHGVQPAQQQQQPQQQPQQQQQLQQQQRRVDGGGLPARPPPRVAPAAAAVAVRGFSATHSKARQAAEGGGSSGAGPRAGGLAAAGEGFGSVVEVESLKQPLLASCGGGTAGDGSDGSDSS